MLPSRFATLAGMANTKYTTERQRSLIRSLGQPHVTGRTFDEAKAIIDEAILAGRLPPYCLEKMATAKQLAFLAGLGIPTPVGLTKAHAMQMIGQGQKARNATIPL